MQDERTIFGEPHRQSLEQLAVEALKSGDAARAFAYADRRCRIGPSPGAHVRVLRAEALFALGDRTAAVAELGRALDVTPEDIAANRRMLVWGERAQRIEAALALVRCDFDPRILREAIGILRADGRRHFANLSVYGAVVRGWAVWQGKTELEIKISGDNGVFLTVIEPDPFHPLADLGRAAGFEVRRSTSPVPQAIMVSIAGETIYATRAPPNEARLQNKLRMQSPQRAAFKPGAPRRAAVIVPVFADFDSLKACLESLRSALAGSGRHRIILVNDAAPDERIADYLQAFAEQPSVTLLTNRQNLGFVGAVNRALEETADEDVILLNSDTVVAPGFADRLAVAAAMAPNIGTIVPLSNNGEETSFPIANQTNPLGTADEIAAIDAAASAVNADCIVDIPNGTGFCLYITRACLDAVGSLSEDFRRGYVEDVDFCLQARARGFRNVCAPFVYVGHAGNKSFGKEKRALVVRNYAVLNRRFPTYQAEVAAFNLADPLAPARRAIERSLPPQVRQPRLLLTGAGLMATVARERARQLASAPLPVPAAAQQSDQQIAGQTGVVVVEVHHEASGPKARIFDPAGGIPQSLQFDLASANGAEAMLAYVRSLAPSAIEILDPAHLPLALVDSLLGLDVSHELFVGDGSIAAERDLRAAATLPRGATTDRAPSVAGPKAKTAARWQDILNAADRILAPSAVAETFVRGRLGAARVQRCDNAAVVKAKRRRRVRTIARLGLLPVRSDGEEQHFMTKVASALRLSNSAAAITVVGETLDDMSLMQIGNTFVTGPVGAGDLDELLRSYRLQALFVAATRPIFGHPVVEAAFGCGLPIAYFDWSPGGHKPRADDLAIDPHASFGDIMAGVERWMAKS
jgi:O-antigen biosynthesis protein